MTCITYIHMFGLAMDCIWRGGGGGGVSYVVNKLSI